MTMEAKELIEALVSATAEMPSLKKTDRNTHGKYNYVSIDDYYEAVAEVAVRHGLTWKIREPECHIVPIGAKEDVPVFGMHARYEVDLMHAPSGTVWDNFFSCSILHPLQGAQTAGSAMSYADKLFMRTVFKVVTGEPDADDTPNDVFDMAPVKKPKAEPKPEKARDETVDAAMLGIATEFVDIAKTEEELKDYWVKNEQVFTNFKKTHPREYKELVAKFTARKAALKEAKASG